MDTSDADIAVQLERRLALVTRWLRASTQPGMSIAALLTLARLEEEGPKRMSELAAAEAVAQPTMTGLVARLEADGLARRGPDRADARAVRVAITPAGRRKLARLRAARAAALRTRLRALDAGAVADLRAALPALDQLTKEGTP